MVAAWFRGGGDGDGRQPAVKDIIKYLYPKKKSLNNKSSFAGQSRFSTLLLEHGEQALQDFAVVAYATPQETNKATGEGTGGGNGGGDPYFASAPPSDKIHWAQSSKRSPQKTNFRSGGSGSGVSRSSSHHNGRPLSLPMDKDSYPSAHMNKIFGRLHLCSRSLVFEPEDSSRAVVRCPFSAMEGSPSEYPADTPGFYGMCIECYCKRHLVMKENNIIGPSETIKLRVRFRFTFLHSSPTAFVQLGQRLFVIAAQTKGSSHQASPELDAILKPMLDRPFYRDNLVDVRELPQTPNLRCHVLTPLQNRVGVVMLTNERLYFQPATGLLNGPEDTPTRVMSLSLQDVVATARRYHGLRDSALEIYWRESATNNTGGGGFLTSQDSGSTLLAFERRHDREQVLRLLPVTAPCLTDRDFLVQVVAEWHNGMLSNYDYLLALNSAAGRSFNDLSRYPVFPWVIADYESDSLDLNDEKTFRDLSKPVGALNEERLEYFKTRLANMHDMDDAFLYGTHYSAPGYVLYYLVRSMPEHMLCLQNGKFDTPDRLFYSLAQCYKSVLSNQADVKELLPEFYNANNDFDFLLNARGLQLGATQNGERVDDVQLPPWARSARDFIKKNRRALESDTVTRMLPSWIDLIFGHKSRGEAALEASNLFHSTAYLGPRELADMQTEQERFTAELQATEFGIVPDQLFAGPHPKRGEAYGDETISPDVGRSSSNVETTREAWELLDAPASGGNIHQHTEGIDETPVDDNFAANTSSRQTSRHNFAVDETVNALPLSGSGETSSLRPTQVGSFGSGDMQDQAMRSGQESTPHKSSRTQPTPSKALRTPGSSSVSISTGWDMKMIERKPIHTDAVSGCVLLLDEDMPSRSILATVSLDGGLMVHKVTLGRATSEEQDRGGFASPFSRFSYTAILSRGQVAPETQSTKLTDYRTHSSRDPLASLVLASDGGEGFVAFAGGHDDVVLAYGINSACAVASVYSHRDAVTGLDLIARTPFDGECALWQENATHIMVSGSWDATLKVWSASVSNGETVAIDREPLAELFDADSSIVCVSAKSIPTGGIVIGAGCADGSFCVWNVHSDGVQVVLHNEKARRGSGPCSVVKWVSEGGNLHLFAAFSTGKVASYTLFDGSLQRVDAVSVGVAVLSLVYYEGALLVGCSDGGLRLIPVRGGASFHSKPILWNAVNNKFSPGISSISVTYTNLGSNNQSEENLGSSDNSTQGRCICVTGAEDGSVALFELRRSSK